MNLSATMDLKAGAFLGPLKAVQGSLGNVIGQMKGLVPLVTGLGGAFAAFKGAESIVENFFKAFEKGHELEKMHRITGESIKDLVILQKAFSSAGVDSGDLQRQLVMLQKSLGGVNEQGEPTKGIFDQLGLSITELQNMDAPAQLAAIGEKMRALPNAAQRTAAAMSIFGRSGADMIAVLNDPDALKDAMESARELGDLYQRNAKIFSEITRLMNSIRGKVSGMFAGLAAGVAPAFKTLLEWVKKLNLFEVGRQVGDVFKAVTQAAREGSLGDFLQASLTVAFQEAANVFSRAMTAAISGLFSYLSNLPGVLIEEFGVLTSPDFWSGIVQLAIGAFQVLGGALLTLFMKPLTYMQAGVDTIVQKLSEGIGKIPGLGQATGLAGYTASSFAENLADRQKNGFFLKDAAAMSLESGAENTLAGVEKIKQASQGFRDAAAKMASEFMAGVKEGWANGETIDTAEGRAGLANMFKGFLERAGVGGGEAVERGGGAGLLGLGGGDKAGSPLGDRLARIGGFIGGAGGPALDYARRTALGVEKVVQNTGKLLSRPGYDFQPEWCG